MASDREAQALAKRARMDQDQASARDGARGVARLIAAFQQELLDGGLDTYLADELTREWATRVICGPGPDDVEDED